MVRREASPLLAGAPEGLRQLLSPSLGPLLPPLRSEIFGPQRFAQHGRSLGLTHAAAQPRAGSASFFPRLRSNIRMLRQAHAAIAAQASTGYDLSPAALWLLDNFHLIEAQLQAIHEGLPRSFFRALPVLLDEPLAGLPRIYGVAWAFVAHTDSAFDEELLVGYLSAYQESRELRLSEMWALPTTLRVVLIENLRRLAERLATQKAARAVANLCCDRIETCTAADLQQLYGQLDRRGVGAAFLAQVGQRLQDRASGTRAIVPVAVQEWLHSVLPQPAALQAQQAMDQTADNLSVSSAVSSLRAIGDADWPQIVARSSTLMRLMLGSPLFAAEHHSTRDQTLHGIEALARRSGRSEIEVAQMLLSMMGPGGADEDADTEGDTEGDTALAGHWLCGPGRAALGRALGLHEPLATAWRAAAPHLALPLYLGAAVLGTWALVAWMLQPGLHPELQGLPRGAWLLAALLLAWPASEAVIAVIHRLVSESAKPQHLARLSLSEGVPPQHRVMVVIPALISDGAGIDGLVHRLHLHYLANPEPNAQFALLTDWADADAAQAAPDDGLLAHAARQIEVLNARHAAPADDSAVPRFLLLHRRRRYSRSEERWIGWERKRGKIEQLLAALAASTTRSSRPGGATEVDGLPGAFVDLGAVSTLAAGTRHLVTLDSDTQLPPGRLRALVGVAAHPANRPRLGRDGRRVVAGFGILQPRIVTPLPTPAEDTLFHRLFAGQCGIDPYSVASSEVYQDLFGEGTFTGKGLLDVQAMHAVLGGHLPEGQVLSHDLLEGALARCGAVTDVALIEDAPFLAEVAASRVHRWTRGDWQLLPILLRSMVQPARYPLGAVNRWKMADNLRRSLVPPVSLALLLLSLGGRGVTPWAALALVAAAFMAGPLMGALAGFVPGREDVAWRHFLRQALADLALAGGGGLWHLAMLLQHGLLAVDAIARALYRMAVSHRHLLQWTTAAAAQAAARGGLRAAWRRHWSLPVVAAVLGWGLWRSDTPWPVLSTTLCLLWGAAPLWSWAASRAGQTRGVRPGSAEDASYLRGIARDTWRWFERCVGPADHHLPPDNLQTAPHDMLAHRTSPTNIGLYLLSVACARRFGWITTAELLHRLEATLATLDILPRHRGHFLNWYDTQTCAALLPMYVSTVDSGNLSGHLLAVAQACLELSHEATPAEAGAGAAGVAGAAGAAAALGVAALAAAATAATAATAEADAAGAAAEQQGRRLRSVAFRCEQLAWQPDFAFLYHRRRHLLHIGWRVAEQQLDTGFYDLLASESRLTSLLAIAKGDVPVLHWAALGRPFFEVGAAAALRSWSGSMFEYLMPALVLAEPHGSVLREACEAALVEQQAYAARHGVPWGISESAYAGCDHTLAYQYAPQGVPALALRRTPADELVIAPYATALAAQLRPHAATLNFARLQSLGARGALGFIEALDYTPSRQTGGEGVTPVHTFMAHHEGMTLVALANVLLDGVAQRWGMANPYIEAVASLLHERAPREVSRLDATPAGPPPQDALRRTPTLRRDVRPGARAVEPTQLLSNGRYSVALRPSGAGHSRWGTSDITRWRDDALRDAHGSFFYLRRGSAAAPVSLTQHPAPDAAAEYSCVFDTDRVAFDTAWPDLQTRITVWVSPEDDVEFRQVELRNLGEHVLEIELISAFEVTLADSRADEAHPAFSNMFVQARGEAAQQALFFERRPRSAGEQGLQMAHFLASCAPRVVALRAQTDRLQWLGRNRSAVAPQARLESLVTGATPVDQATTALDTGLDPVCALGVPLRIAVGGKVRLTFATAASDQGPTLNAIVDKYRQGSHIERASLMSATLGGIRLRALRLNADEYAAVQTLSTALLFSLTRPLATAQVCDRRLLWRFGLSGERPLVLVSAGAPQGLALVRTLSQALGLWAWGGVGCDLVVISAEPASYAMPLQRELGALRDRHEAEAGARAGTGGGLAASGWHLLRAEDLSADELSTLQYLARVRIVADGRPLTHPVREWAEQHEQARLQRQEASQTALEAVPTAGATAAVGVSQGQFGEAAGPVGPPTSTPLGSHAVDEAPGGEFGFDVSVARRPPRPWINVLANPGFGTLVSEAGGGTTWAINSRLNQLTPWSNDPVADPPSEWLLLQDPRTREVWSVSPGAWAAADTDYRVTHSQGWTRISHRRGDLEVDACWCVDVATAVKQVQLRFVNHGPRRRALRLIAITEWMMGSQRSDRATIHTAQRRLRQAQGKLTVLLATQQERSAGFGGGTAFVALAAPPRVAAAAGAASAAEPDSESDDWTCDRRECFDARGRLVLPDAWGRRAGSGLDPCGVLSTALELPAGATQERSLLLGYAADADLAQQLALQAAAVPAAQRLREARAGWDALLGATEVRTPDPLFDALVNRWLLYQAVGCRLWAKAGGSQAGGATGFRDQLQDSMALAWAAPQLLRAQILHSAGHQFVEGDVQHWWHAPLGAGVRTHFSDDLLWLPYALAHYLHRTGDLTLLDESLPFIEGLTIPAGAEDVYGTPSASAERASVYEHAARAIDHSLRVGVHGLPLMGSGDWNDGMNRVGWQGRGESVWLAWFLCRVVGDFAPVARSRGDGARAQRWDDAAQGWQLALQGPAWDGQWYVRAFFDDGQALGTHANAEARIDLIAQAWGVLSGVAPPARQAAALASVQRLLLDEPAGLVRLLDPPLAESIPSAGYIQAYPPGVRENGGQYTHAGVWALMAQAQWAKAQPDPRPGLDLAWRYFTCLSPAHRTAPSAPPAEAAAYGIEPYVMAGDTYTAAPWVGRGGWSWYTGAAAWMHRASVESILGLVVEAHRLCVTPGLPTHWPQAELTLRRDARVLRILLLRADAAAAMVQAADWRGGESARLLLPGEWLDWTVLPAAARLVVPLGQVRPAAAAPVVPDVPVRPEMHEVPPVHEGPGVPAAAAVHESPE